LGVAARRERRFHPDAIADHCEGNGGAVLTDTFLTGKQQGMGNGSFSI
jgi:hypothetical protein